MNNQELWSIVGNDGNAPDGDWISHIWFNRREAAECAEAYNKDAKMSPGRDPAAPYRAVRVRVCVEAHPEKEQKMNIEELVRALSMYLEAAAAEKAARENYDGYDWHYHGHRYIGETDLAAKDFGAALDAYIDARIAASRLP